ncbi:MAG: hypothetical protein ACYCZF_04455 [Anaerolineae bacterium]
MFYVGGRRIKVATGVKTQTVNICTDANILGEYDYIVRLHESTATEGELVEQRFTSIVDLIRYLQATHHAAIERTPASTPAQQVVARPPQGAMSAWETEAVAIVEEAIDHLVTDFVATPYLHRVEHSIHCELFRLLKSYPLLAETYPLGSFTSQCVHKEWPETLVRPEHGNYRGNFDLAILSPEVLASAAIDEFSDGRLRPIIAIEFGLNYPLGHLQDDEAKLVNSGLAHSYLIHLVRGDYSDNFGAVERFVTESRIKTAYARAEFGRAAYKLVNDREIKRLERAQSN